MPASQSFHGIGNQLHPPQPARFTSSHARQLGNCPKRHQHTDWHQDRKRSTKPPPSASLWPADLDPSSLNAVFLQVVPFPPCPGKASSNPGSGNITDAKLQRGKHFPFINKSQLTGLSWTAHKTIQLTLTTPAGNQILGVNRTLLPSSYRNRYSSKYFSGWLRTDPTGRAAGAWEDLNPAQLHTPASDKQTLRNRYFSKIILQTAPATTVTEWNTKAGILHFQKIVLGYQVQCSTQREPSRGKDLFFCFSLGTQYSLSFPSVSGHSARSSSCAHKQVVTRSCGNPVSYSASTSLITGWSLWGSQTDPCSGVSLFFPKDKLRST